ncbi:MAG: ABC transporter permease [Deinococcales bacterium]|nr:ABC transporter permease [Deinococcales bacterium]
MTTATGDTLRSSQKDEQHKSVSVRAVQWRIFRQNRLAILGLVVLGLFFLLLAFGDFIAPYRPAMLTPNPLAPPHRLHFRDADGAFHWRPFYYAYDKVRDMKTFKTTYVEDTTKKMPLRLFIRGDSYRMWGLFETDLHLFGVNSDHRVHIIGSDELGRDLFSRLVWATRISLTIGLLGVVISLVLGALLGVISGYYGGVVDVIMQRLIELLMSFPQIPLWMAFAAIIPVRTDPLLVYFLITIILSFINWTGLARQIRGMTLSLKERDYALAAQAMGASDLRIMVRHILPNTIGHMIVISTLAVPGMILAETALSFLGLGIREPMLSWGTLLKQAQSLHMMAQAPWVLIPALAVVASVLAFNFVGDGLRDSLDPYER